MTSKSGCTFIFFFTAPALATQNTQAEMRQIELQKIQGGRQTRQREILSSDRRLSSDQRVTCALATKGTDNLATSTG